MYLAHFDTGKEIVKSQIYNPYSLLLRGKGGKAGIGWMGGDALPGKKDVDKIKPYKHIHDRPPDKLMALAGRRVFKECF